MNNPNKINVYIAGYILKAPTNSPCKINARARCVPQPKHGNHYIRFFVM